MLAGGRGTVGQQSQAVHTINTRGSWAMTAVMLWLSGLSTTDAAAYEQTYTHSMVGSFNDD